MVRCATLVIGPAGAGKSTYCNLMRTHCEAQRRRVHVVNLDPAAEHFRYPVAADIRDLVPLEDVMSELRLGPNGGLIYAMEHLVDNIDWLESELDDLGGDEYVLFDCPGQVELYSHVPAMSRVVSELQRMGFRLASVYLIDSTFLQDAPKFVAGVLACLSAMTMLELPHCNVLSKCDLLPNRRLLDELLDADAAVLRSRLDEGTRPAFLRLNSAICELLEDWSMVQFLPLDPRDTDSVDEILAQIDNALQYHEDVEPRDPDERDEDDAEVEEHDES